MKRKVLLFVQVFMMLVIGCNTISKEENIKNLDRLESNILIDKSKELIKKGYTKQQKGNYLSDKLLIAKKGKLKEYKSLNIKGHRFYELDKRGNIKATYDISNNYSVYTYDKKNRLIKSENKQHNPPEVYNDVKYKYSKGDSVVTIISTTYQNNKPIETIIKNEEILLNEKGVRKIYFENKNISDFYLSPEKVKIVAYEEEMIFCCGVEMKGKNKLIYHINKKELIDSLIIEGIESGDRMKLEYDYE